MGGNDIKPQQIVAIFREAERGLDRQAFFRKHGICEQTFYGRYWELLTERGRPPYT